MRHLRFMLLLLTVRVACMRPSQRAIEVPREICCPAGTYVVRSHILKPRAGIPHPRCVPWACLCLYICRTYIYMYVYRPSLASAPPAPSPATTSTIYSRSAAVLCAQLHLWSITYYMVCMVQVNYKMHVTTCISIAMLICMFHGQC